MLIHNVSLAWIGLIIAVRPFRCNSILSYATGNIEKHRHKVTNMYNVRETEIAANDCSGCVAEIIITNSSPDTVVVQFQTSFM